jgi:hypothetical protein
LLRQFAARTRPTWNGAASKNLVLHSFSQWLLRT